MRLNLRLVVPSAVFAVALTVAGCAENNEAGVTAGSGTIAQPTTPAGPVASSPADFGNQMKNRGNPLAGSGYPGAPKKAGETKAETKTETK